MYRAYHRWEDAFSAFSEACEGIRNQKGRSRGSEENKLLLLAMCASLKRHIKAARDDKHEALSIRWSAIEHEVAEDFFVAKVEVCF